MDRRILERRRAVQRETAARRRRLTASALVLIGLVALGAVAARSPLFAIQRVEVSGVRGEEAAAVRVAAGLRIGENLLSADLGAAASGVRELPWVSDVDVVRLPPSGVEILIDPREPVAVVEAPGGAWVVDADGWVIARGAAELPVIEAANSVLPGEGSQASDVALRNALAVRGGLPEKLRSQVDRYDAPSERGLRLHLRGGDAGDVGVWVRFGSAERVQMKAQVIQLLLDQAREQSELTGAVDLRVSEIDVRAPDNPVLVPSG